MSAVGAAQRVAGAPAVRAGRIAAPCRAALGVVAATGVDLAIDPTHTHIPLCPFHAFTGLWCPLCGGLRAVYTLAHGHLATAFRDNAVFVACLPAMLVAWVAWVLAARDGRPVPRVSRTAVATLAVVLVAFTVLRNLAFADVLRPQ